MKRREVKRGIRITGAEHEEILCRLGSGRNDGDVVARSSTRFELLVDVRADAAAEPRIELGDVNDLHIARRIEPGRLLVDESPKPQLVGGPELCSERRGL